MKKIKKQINLLFLKKLEKMMEAQSKSLHDKIDSCNDTIKGCNKKIEILTEENKALKEEVKELRIENQALKNRFDLANNVPLNHIFQVNIRDNKSKTLSEEQKLSIIDQRSESLVSADGLKKSYDSEYDSEEVDD